MGRRAPGRVIGTGHEVDRPTLAWWHPISAKFVHGLLIALQLLGLVNPWHRYNVVVSIPFFVWWRRLLVGNLEHLRSGQPPDRGSRTRNRLGILVAALLCVFTSAVALAAWLGSIR